MTVTTTHVGIGELTVVRGEGATLRTHSLGSCVAVVLVDRVRSVVGMAHVVLPTGDDQSRPAKPTGYFADSAIRALFDEMAKNGSGPKMGPLHVVVIGGGSAGRTTASVFNIGDRNLAAVRAELVRAKVIPAVEDTGGAWSRTVTASVREIVITCPDRSPLHL